MISKFINLIKYVYFLKKYKIARISIAQICKKNDLVNIFHPIDDRGGMTIQEISYLILISKSFDVKHVLEIGSFRGRTSLNLVRNKQNLKLYTLDLPEGISDDKDLQFRLKNTDKVQAFDDNKNYYLNKYKDSIEGQSYAFHGDSAIFDFDIFKVKFDMIIIDASHKYENVLIDSENAIKYLNKNGIIIWHDYSIAHIEVVKAIHKIKKKYNITVSLLKNSSFAIHIRD